jgi:hypothetical protein
MEETKMKEVVIFNPEWETEIEWIVSEDILNPDTGEFMKLKGEIVTERMLCYLANLGLYSIKAEPMKM